MIWFFGILCALFLLLQAPVHFYVHLAEEVEIRIRILFFKIQPGAPAKKPKKKKKKAKEKPPKKEDAPKGPTTEQLLAEIRDLMKEQQNEAGKQ